MLRIIKVLPAVLILIVSSCVTDDYARLKAEVNDLRKMQQQQKEDVTDIQKRLSISDTQKGKADMLNALRESQENLNSKVTHLNRELQQLVGRVEERKFYVDKAIAESKTDRDLLKAQIETVEGEIGDLRGRIDRIESALQQKGIATPRADAKPPAQKPSTSAAKEPATPQPTPQPAEATNPKAIYDEAMREFHAGKYKESREKFNRIVKEFPTSSLASNGYFWIGESYYKEGSYEDAILSYDVVVKKYPNSDKVPGAKLKQALAFIEIKDPKPAKAILQQIIDDYPQSHEAEQAKKQLQSLGSSNQVPAKKPAETTKKTSPAKRL